MFDLTLSQALDVKFKERVIHTFQFFVEKASPPNFIWLGGNPLFITSNRYWYRPIP